MSSFNCNDMEFEQYCIHLQPQRNDAVTCVPSSMSVAASRVMTHRQSETPVPFLHHGFVDNLDLRSMCGTLERWNYFDFSKFESRGKHYRLVNKNITWDTVLAEYNANPKLFDERAFITTEPTNDANVYHALAMEDIVREHNVKGQPDSYYVVLNTWDSQNSKKGRWEDPKKELLEFAEVLIVSADNEGRNKLYCAKEVLAEPRVIYTKVWHWFIDPYRNDQAKFDKLIKNAKHSAEVWYCQGQFTMKPAFERMFDKKSHNFFIETLFGHLSFLFGFTAKELMGNKPRDFVACQRVGSQVLLQRKWLLLQKEYECIARWCFNVLARYFDGSKMKNSNKLILKVPSVTKCVEIAKWIDHKNGEFFLATFPVVLNPRGARTLTTDTANDHIKEYMKYVRKMAKKAKKAPASKVSASKVSGSSYNDGNQNALDLITSLLKSFGAI
eukprot:16482_1